MGFHNFVGFKLLAVLCFTYVSARSEFCGLAKDNPDKICISVRLPWQENPIYFCQDKEKFTYRRQCGLRDRSDYSSFSHQNQKGHLLVATPWDCSPLSSVPDICTNTQCPSKPFNRTCVEVSLKNNSMECCAQSFCEEGIASINECHKKILEPSCQEPPKDKKKCIGFHDPNGCCTKFQCEGDGKPGLCPMENEALSYTVKSNDTDEDTSTSKGEYNIVQRSNEPAPFRKARHRRPYIRHEEQINCVGDYNCQGKMKCCSNELDVYSDDEDLNKIKNPTFGYCIDPVKL